jgi:hypothetical protein
MEPGWIPFKQLFTWLFEKFAKGPDAVKHRTPIILLKQHMKAGQ